LDTIFYDKFTNKSQYSENIEEIDVDEMFSYFGKKKNLFGSGKLLIITLASSSGGNAVIVVPKP
jgi:hypothetical protein